MYPPANLRSYEYLLGKDGGKEGREQGRAFPGLSGITRETHQVTQTRDRFPSWTTDSLPLGPGSPWPAALETLAP